MENFFILLGVASFSWYLCKLIFWLDTPNNNLGGKLK